MHLFHFTGKTSFVLSQEQNDDYVRNHYRSDKPPGFWVSVGTSWKDWCEREGYGDCSYQYKVELKPNANILCITSGEELNIFNEQWETTTYNNWFGKGIRWKDLITCYQGIIISPYDDTYSEIYMWYSSWT